MKTLDLENLVKELSDRVATLEKLNGLADWVSPSAAAPRIGLSASAIKTEIRKANECRLLGRSHWLKYGVHYRKDGAHWKVCVDEFKAVWGLPESDRKPLKNVS